MKCPKCGSGNIVGAATLQAIQTSDNWIDCLDCGCRWSNWQQVEIERSQQDKLDILDGNCKVHCDLIERLQSRIDELDAEIQRLREGGDNGSCRSRRSDMRTLR